MEHAIRKHCTVHHDEDPAFYKSLSEKVENLIDQYKGHWDLLIDELEKLRTEAIEGRKTGQDGMTKEASIFFEHITNETFKNTKISQDTKIKMQDLMDTIVDTLQDSIGSIDFWANADKQKKARSNIKTAFMLTDIVELKKNRERVNGESFLYLGRSYRLSLVAGQKADLKLKQGRFCLKRSLIDQGGELAAKKAFETFYLTKGENRLSKRLDYFAPRVGVKPAGLKVKDLGFRWASCTKNNLVQFHWKCMMAPPKIVDYMVAHELCHMHHRNLKR